MTLRIITDNVQGMTHEDIKQSIEDALEWGGEVTLQTEHGSYVDATIIEYDGESIKVVGRDLVKGQERDLVLKLSEIKEVDW